VKVKEPKEKKKETYKADKTRESRTKRATKKVSIGYRQYLLRRLREREESKSKKKGQERIVNSFGGYMC